MLAAGLIKVLCVGLFAHEQQKLPPIASTSAYSSAACVRSTPLSVQVLAQAMSSVVLMIKNRYAFRNSINQTPKNMSKDALLIKFKTMLRSSYMCMTAGVMFVKTGMIPPNTVEKRIRTPSYFAEWLNNDPQQVRA